MTIKTITQPVTGQVFRFGRRRPVAQGPRFMLKNYLRAPVAPASGDYRAAAASALANIYMNDSLGDCVIAGMGHVEGVLTGNAGALFTYTDAQIVTEYGAIGGYVPGNPSTDQGCDEQTALNYWMSNGFPDGSHQIAGWMAVDASNPAEYKAALYLFENLYFGVELPDAWVNPMPSASGFTWDAAGDADPNNGHCFIGDGWSPEGITIDTWGMSGLITDAAIEKYASASDGGALYCVVSMDGIAKATAKAPNGLDWSQLTADFDSMGGNVTP